MCILFCEILFSTDLGTDYECNHWISYPKQKKAANVFVWESLCYQWKDKMINSNILSKVGK